MTTALANFSSTELAQFYDSQNQSYGSVIDTTGLVSMRNQHETFRAWEVARSRLSEWAKNPQDLSIDGIEPPLPEVIARAIRFCRVSAAQEDDDLPRVRVVPDGEGGVIFERRRPPIFSQLRIRSDGSIEIIYYKDNSITSREVRV